MAKWEESKHPRDDDGKFTDKGQGTPAERKRLEEMGIEKNKETNYTIEQTLREEEKINSKKENIKRLVQVLKQIKKIKVKELFDIIRNFDSVNLSTDDKELIAEFDKYTANKNIYGHGKSDKEGYIYKLNNIHSIPKIIKTSQYNYSKKEIGKNTPQHKDVKSWHYFTNEIKTDKGDFNVIVNIRDKGNKQFVYEVAIKRKKT